MTTAVDPRLTAALYALADAVQRTVIRLGQPEGHDGYVAVRDAAQLVLADPNALPVAREVGWAMYREAERQRLLVREGPARIRTAEALIPSVRPIATAPSLAGAADTASAGGGHAEG